MESSHILGSREECSGIRGSESGWTSYIASNIHRDEDDHITDKQEYYRKGNYGSDDDDGGNTDDSMASDASSGPSHHEIDERRVRRGASKQHAITKCLSKENLRKQVKQKDDGVRMKAEKEGSTVKAKSASSHVQGRNSDGGRPGLVPPPAAGRNPLIRGFCRLPP